MALNGGPVAATITIDPDGDLRLLVGKKKVPFIVCSKTLARSAPFFKTALYGPFSESVRPKDGKDQWTLELPEDDPRGLEVILHLVHGQPHKLAKITVDLAFEVTVLTNKYDMTSCLWFVTKEWLEELSAQWPCSCANKSKTPYLTYKDNEPCYTSKEQPPSGECVMPPLEWLWITKELGDMDRYQTTLQAFAYQTTKNRGTGDLNISLLRTYGKSLSVSRDPISNSSAYSSSGTAVRACLVEDIRAARRKTFQCLTGPILLDFKTRQGVAQRHQESAQHDGSAKTLSTVVCTADGVHDRDKKIMCDIAVAGAIHIWELKDQARGKVVEKYLSPLRGAGILDVDGGCLSARALHSIFINNGFVMRRWNEDLRILLSDEHRNCGPFNNWAYPSERDIWAAAGQLTDKEIKYINRQATLSGLKRVKATQP